MVLKFVFWNILILICTRFGFGLMIISGKFSIEFGR